MRATTSPREIAALVPMSHLLTTLGFETNERTRRGPCSFHGGSNRSAFSWTATGLWKCHSCGAGGDKIALVRAARKCSFREAVEFLAALAGVNIRANPLSQAEISQRRSEQTSLRYDASVALAVDSSFWDEARDIVLQLEAIRRDAGRRLQEIFEGSQERWSGESEFCWAALAEVSRQMPRAAATYTIASFGKFQYRLRFVLDLVTAEQLIGNALENGYVAGERGYRFEIIQ